MLEESLSYFSDVSSVHTIPQPCWKCWSYFWNGWCCTCGAHSVLVPCSITFEGTRKTIGGHHHFLVLWDVSIPRSFWDVFRFSYWCFDRDDCSTVYHVWKMANQSKVDTYRGWYSLIDYHFCRFDADVSQCSKCT